MFPNKLKQNVFRVVQVTSDTIQHRGQITKESLTIIMRYALILQQMLLSYDNIVDLVLISKSKMR